MWLLHFNNIKAWIFAGESRFLCGWTMMLPWLNTRSTGALVTQTQRTLIARDLRAGYFEVFSFLCCQTAIASRPCWPSSRKRFSNCISTVGCWWVSDEDERLFKRIKQASIFDNFGHGALSFSLVECGRAVSIGARSYIALCTRGCFGNKGSWQNKHTHNKMLSRFQRWLSEHKIRLQFNISY